MQIPHFFDFRQKKGNLLQKPTFAIITIEMKTKQLGSTTTDLDQTDCEQCRLAENCNPKYIFTIPRAILPKPSLCD